MAKVPVKFPVEANDLVMLEKALRLKVPSTFETNMLNNMAGRYAEFGSKMVVTEKQREVLKVLAGRFDKIWESH